MTNNLLFVKHITNLFSTKTSTNNYIHTVYLIIIDTKNQGQDQPSLFIKKKKKTPEGKLPLCVSLNISSFVFYFMNGLN